jgi:hypothetical protein
LLSGVLLIIFVDLEPKEIWTLSFNLKCVVIHTLCRSSVRWLPGAVELMWTGYNHGHLG